MSSSSWSRKNTNSRLVISTPPIACDRVERTTDRGSFNPQSTNNGRAVAADNVNEFGRRQMQIPACRIGGHGNGAAQTVADVMNHLPAADPGRARRRPLPGSATMCAS